MEVACATTEESDEDYGMADMGDTVWWMRSCCVSAIEFDSISSGLYEILAGLQIRGFEISKLKFKFPRARNYELTGKIRRQQQQ